MGLFWTPKYTESLYYTILLQFVWIFKHKKTIPQRGWPLPGDVLLSQGEACSLRNLHRWCKLRKAAAPLYYHRR